MKHYIVGIIDSYWDMEFRTCVLVRARARARARAKKGGICPLDSVLLGFMPPLEQNDP